MDNILWIMQYLYTYTITSLKKKQLNHSYFKKKSIKNVVMN